MSASSPDRRTAAPRAASSLNRPWLVLTGLCLGVCVTNGFARFGYGLILPAMQVDLGWNYTQAGWLNTANALGYVAGAVLTMLLISRVGPSRLFVIGLVTTTIALLATGLNAGLWWQTLWRGLAGFLGAMSFSTAGALTTFLFPNDPRRTALAIALLFGSGGGVGIILAGAGLPLFLAQAGPQAWPWAWVLIGLTSLSFVPLGIWAARQLRASAPALKGLPVLPYGKMLGEFAGYAGFGLGYIVYLTFLGAWMVEAGASPMLAAGVWVLVGTSISASPFLWRGILERKASGLPLALILMGISAGTVLPVYIPGGLGLVASALLFGGCVFMAPGAVTSFARHNLPAESWGGAIAVFTVVFAIAQTIGPIAAGWIGDVRGDLSGSLYAASVVLLIGGILAAFQRPITPDN